MRLRFLLLAVLALIVVSAASTIGFAQVANPNGAAGQVPISARQQPQAPRTTLATQKTLEVDRFRVECSRKIEVAAQADGLIQAMEVDEGSAVPQGSVLFRIDNRVAAKQAEVADKKLESAKKQAEQDAELKFAQASHKLAQSEYESERDLLASASTTIASARRKELEATKTRLSIEAAQVKRESDALAAGVAEAEFNAAKVQLELYDIVAPWDAYVNERLKDQGAWIRAGEPVLKINHMAEMKVGGYIKINKIYERGWSINNLEGALMRVVVDITPTQQHVVDTTITFVSAEIDDSDNVRVTGRIKNERIGNSWLLRDGAPARVTIVVE